MSVGQGHRRRSTPSHRRPSGRGVGGCRRVPPGRSGRTWFAPSGTIDLVMANHSLDDDDDLGRTLRQVHRVLKPGALSCWRWTTVAESGWRRWSPALRRRSPHGGELLTALDRTNFRIEAFHELGVDDTTPVPTTLSSRPAGPSGSSRGGPGRGRLRQHAPVGTHESGRSSHVSGGTGPRRPCSRSGRRRGRPRPTTVSPSTVATGTPRGTRRRRDGARLTPPAVARAVPTRPPPRPAPEQRGDGEAAPVRSRVVRTRGRPGGRRARPADATGLARRRPCLRRRSRPGQRLRPARPAHLAQP